MNNLSTCVQVNIFIDPATSKEMLMHSCAMYNIVPCYTVLVTSYLRDSDVFCSILLKFP